MRVRDADKTLGVAVCGSGWCAAQHIAAFQRNPHTHVTWIVGRDVARTQAALSKSGLDQAGISVTDWYGGWNWVKTRESGRSHLLAAGCHAVDALRWCSGLEPIEVSAYHTHFTEGYEWPTSIAANMRLAGGAIGHVTSSTDFMMP